MKRLMTSLKRAWLCLTLTALALAFPGAVRANPEVCAKTLPKTVWVVRPDGCGSGVLIDRNLRLVATVEHVVEGVEEVTVFFPVKDKAGEWITDPSYYREREDKLGIRARVVARKGKADLALLQLDRVPRGVEPVKLAHAPPRQGEPVHALGNSGVRDGVLWRYSPGQVRNVYFKNWAAEGHQYAAKVVETTLPTNGGDSGGPVVNDQGELVALTSGGDVYRAAPPGWEHPVPVRVVCWGIYVQPLVNMIEKFRTEEGAAVETQAAPAKSLVGAWQRTTADEKGNIPCWVFRADGTVELLSVNTRSRKAKTLGVYSYRLSRGVLTLTPNDEEPIQVQLSWQGTSRFTLTLPGGESSTWVRLQDRGDDDDDARPAPRPAPKAAGSLIGALWVCAEADENGLFMVLKFEDDGSVAMGLVNRAGKVVESARVEYQYSNGSLTLYVPGKVFRARLTWNGPNQFTLTWEDGKSTVYVRG